MSYLFSSDFKFRTWRRLWIALAEAEKELGLEITDEQIAALKTYADEINYADAEQREREIRHDVMSHIYAYGLQAKAAKGIIHLGASSASAAAIRSRDRRIRAKWTRRSWPRSPDLPSPPRSSGTTCVCCSICARSRSRTKRSRSAPPRWHTSAIRCVRSGSTRWRGT